MKIHIFSGHGTSEDNATLYIDRVEGDAAFALALVEAELSIIDGVLTCDIVARNTTNKPHVKFNFKTAESLDQAAAERLPDR